MRRLPVTSNPPPPARADSAEASWAASTGDSCEAERPNSTCDSTSSLGRTRFEVKLTSRLFSRTLDS